MSAFWSREAYKLRRWELRFEARVARHQQRFASYPEHRAVASCTLAAAERDLLLIDCGTVGVSRRNPRLAEALRRNSRMVAERLHAERVAVELPKVQAAAKAAGMSKFDTALAELGVSWGGKTAREALA